MVWFFGSDSSKDSNSQSSTTDGQPQNYETSTHYSSYSSSRTCSSDPENNEFMICKERVIENGKEYLKEERFHVNDMHMEQDLQMFPGFFSNFFRGIDGTHSMLDSKLNNFEQQFPSNFNRLQNMFLPFFSMMEPQLNPNFSGTKNFQNPPQERLAPVNEVQNNNSNNHRSKKQYFSSQERDTEIRDL